MNDHHAKSDSELAELATTIYQLVDDLPFDQACKVLNAVLTTKTISCWNPPINSGEFVSDKSQLTVQDREAGPRDNTGDNRPNLHKVPILVPNKLPVLIHHADVGSGKHVSQEMSNSEGGDLKVTVGDVTFSSVIF